VKATAPVTQRAEPAVPKLVPDEKPQLTKKEIFIESFKQQSEQLGFPQEMPVGDYLGYFIDDKNFDVLTSPTGERKDPDPSAVKDVMSSYFLAVAFAMTDGIIKQYPRPVDEMDSFLRERQNSALQTPTDVLVKLTPPDLRTPDLHKRIEERKASMREAQKIMSKAEEDGIVTREELLESITKGPNIFKPDNSPPLSYYQDAAKHVLKNNGLPNTEKNLQAVTALAESFYWPMFQAAMQGPDIIKSFEAHINKPEAQEAINYIKDRKLFQEQPPQLDFN
jgi:hypothetical protein